MRPTFALVLALALSACAATAPQDGIANYDSLKQAQEKCMTEGGKLMLKPGGNSRWLEDYSCKGK